jgi:hypothetical protein
MRPIEKGAVPTDDNGQPKQYSEYQQARPDLIKRLGEYFLVPTLQRPIQSKKLTIMLFVTLERHCLHSNAGALEREKIEQNYNHDSTKPLH